MAANHVKTAWTPELKERVKVLWENHSAAQIAGVLNCDGFTFTRNSIIGVLHRANLTSTHKTEEHPLSRSAARQPRSSANHVRRPKMVVEEFKLRCVEIVPRNLTLMDLEPGDCRYPYGGHDDPITFCGHPKMESTSYCVPHFHLCRSVGTRAEQMAGIAA